MRSRRTSRHRHMAEEGSASFRLSHADGVGTLLIDRPEKRNALSRAMLAALPKLLAQAAADPAIRVLIVTGGAGRAFSTGADIGEFEEVYATREATEHFAALFAGAQAAMAGFPKPSVAMVSGPCVGGGCGLALGCDMRFADSDARFGITPAKLGLDYGLSDTRRVVDAIGYAAASDLLFSGRLIDAVEAGRIGLVSRVVAPDALDATTRDWAEAAARMSPASHRSIKATLSRIRGGATVDDAQSREAFMAAFASADFAEGRRAFVERRAPDFPDPILPE